MAKRQKLGSRGETMKILEVEGLNKHFGGVLAAADVTFDVGQGEILGLIGPNGAGKTTLFNLVSGALVPDSGLIRFKNKSIVGLNPYRICRMGIARTFQSVKVFSKMSVFNNVLLGCLFGRGRSAISATARGKTVEILKFVELSGMRDWRAMDLILAHQKRLELARALA